MDRLNKPAAGAAMDSLCSIDSGRLMGVPNGTLCYSSLAVGTTVLRETAYLRDYPRPANSPQQGFVIPQQHSPFSKKNDVVPEFDLIG